jgi:ribosomal protein L32
MADEILQAVVGDSVAAALEEHRRKRRFGWRKKPKKETQQLTHCENCGEELRGHWCAQCGQPAIDYRRSFRHVVVDVLDSFLNWDLKFVATIGWLIVRPWRLTNEFLAGHRVRYFHPLRLYLLASILFFFAVNYGAKSIPDPSKITPKNRAEIEEELKKEDLPPQVRARLEKALQKRAASESGAKPEASPQSVAGENQDDGPSLRFGPEDKKSQSEFGKWMEMRAREKFGEHGSNAKLFIITLISNLPYMMLCCIPLFAFVLEILYIRKHVFYIDHLVYALHIHSFAYVAVMIIGLTSMALNRIAPAILAGGIIGLLWLAFVAQILLSIRRVYRQGWFLSVLKFFGGGLAYLIVLAIAVGITFLVTIALP